MAITTISWTNGRVKMIDQTKLPNKLTYLYCDNVNSLWAAIKRLSVRGAPALGAAAAFGVLLGAKTYKGSDRGAFDRHVKKVSEYIGTSRPTAVNLFHCLELMRQVLREYPAVSVNEAKELLKKEAMRIYEKDRRVCRKIGDNGAQFIKQNANVMTVCNAGALATVDYGTALGVMYSAKKKKKKFHVYVTETRPLLQGARLTTWELLRGGIDTTLVSDNMAAALMYQGKVDAVFAGADRIAANGDVANKIGTYSLAVLAKYHKIPFYIVAPLSTFDRSISSGKGIVIEQRHKSEVMGFGREVTAPKNVKVYNPAFDVTEHKLITTIITEAGIIKSPFKANIQKVFKKNASC